MVVIEPEETQEETKLINESLNPESSTRTTPGNSGGTTSNTTSVGPTGDNDSDGFETASERGVSDRDDDDEEEKQKPLNDVAAAAAAANQLAEEESNDEDSKKKALEEGNEAKLEGNKLFVEGKYEEALLKYEVALELASQDVDLSGELRATCYSNRAVCFLKLEKYQETVKECTKALELNPSYVKALLRRAEANEKLENFEEAISDMKKILEVDPSNVQASKAIRHLDPLAAEKREKMKEEMIGKLKDMGNSLLGRFGMSLDNFKAVKDPNTGSYSISFQQ